MPELLEIIARQGVERFLRSLLNSSVTGFARTELENRLSEVGASSPRSTVDDLLGVNLLQRTGARFGISRLGHRVALLIDALNGGDIDDIVRRLRRLDGSVERYEMVRQGMTTRFLDTFVEHPYFGSLYICSPWINLNEKETSLIRYGVLLSEKRTGRRPDIHVITRPAAELPEEIRATGMGMRPLIEMGARVYYIRNVHSKLYIREPDENGGYGVALVGSENLTQSNYLELGIQINGDGRLISQLIAHFYEMTSYSSETE
jgi:hypothetical protein